MNTEKITLKDNDIDNISGGMTSTVTETTSLEPQLFLWW